MPVFKFRVYWEEDDQIYRDIALLNGQSFKEFNDAILLAYEFDKKQSASFFESNDKWQKGREISSEVLINKKDAPALSMVKTPVSALIDQPEKKFVYIYDPNKQWTFLVQLIAVEKEGNPNVCYPLCIRKEGIAPAQTGVRKMAEEKLMEIEEKYDLSKDEIEEGYGNEGEGDLSSLDNDLLHSGEEAI